MSEDARVAGLVDEVQLARWMDARKLPGAGEKIETRFVTGGASNEIFEIRRGEARMALRRPPRLVPKGRNETMLREARVLAALADSDVPHARLLGVCDDPAVLGACFYVMDWVEGWTPLGPLPEPFLSDLESKKGLGDELVDAIANLSRVDWRAGGLAGFGKPEGFLERQVDRWLAHLASFSFRELPGLDAAAAWLRARTPRSFRPGILHGDYQFANVMFAHGAPAKLAAIVDWEMTTVGDPLIDLGWVIQGWPKDDAEPSDAGYVPMDGMPKRTELLAHYTEVSGRPTNQIGYYEILAGFKLAIVLEGQYSRYKTGKLDNPKIEAFAPIVVDMLSKTAELTKTARI